MSIGGSDKERISAAPILLEAQLKREFELAHSNIEQRIQLLRQVLGGMATNGTACLACKLHNEIYRDALERDDELARRDLL